MDLRSIALSKKKKTHLRTYLTMWDKVRKKQLIKLEKKSRELKEKIQCISYFYQESRDRMEWVQR